MANKKTIEQQELPEELVWDIIRYAQSMSSPNGYPSILTPETVSARLKEINLNPLAATQDTLDAALTSPRDNESSIRSFGDDFELKSQPYKRLLSYLGTTLSFDYTYTCINAEYDDYKSKAYKKDLKILTDFCDRFDFKKEFEIIVTEMLRHDAYFGIPRFDTKQFVVQELPVEYTKITGRWDYGFLASFNFYFFLQPGVDLRMYPPFFQQTFNDLFKDGGSKKYNPSIDVDERGNSRFVYWVDLPPDQCFIWKMNPHLATNLPYFSPLFNDLVLQALMRNLQKNINMAVASKMLFGEVPMLNKEAKATVKDNIAVTPELLGKFLALVRSAISDAIKIASAPLTNMQGIEFTSENDLYSSFLKTALASSGINSNLIFTNDQRTNTMETQLSLNTDESLMETLYPQFNAFVNYFVNKATSKYKFMVEFEGTNFFTNRQKRLDDALALANLGIVLPQKISAAIGMRPFSFQRQLDEARANGWVDTLTPIVSAFNQSAESQNSKGSDGGRPKKKDSELSDSGEQTRASGGNLSRGGKV